MIPLPQTYFLPPSLPSNTRLTGKLVAVRGKRDRGNQGRGLSDQIEHGGGYPYDEGDGDDSNDDDDETDGDGDDNDNDNGDDIVKLCTIFTVFLHFKKTFTFSKEFQN